MSKGMNERLASIPENNTALEVQTMITEASRRRTQIKESLLRWASENLRDFPWRRNRNPYNIMVAEFLLKRTTSTAVKRVYDDFITSYPNIKELTKEDQHSLESFLKTIGYHKLRAKALKETASYITEELDGEIPRDWETLISIPNIGPYTAGAILSLGYHQSAPMVDSNVKRILLRMFKNTVPEKAVMKRLLQVARVLIPKEDHDLFNLGLLDLGALVCRYDRPRCEFCPLSNLCDHVGSLQ